MLLPHGVATFLSADVQRVSRRVSALSPVAVRSDPLSLLLPSLVSFLAPSGSLVAPPASAAGLCVAPPPSRICSAWFPSHARSAPSTPIIDKSSLLSSPSFLRQQYHLPKHLECWPNHYSALPYDTHLHSGLLNANRVNRRITTSDQQPLGAYERPTVHNVTTMASSAGCSDHIDLGVMGRRKRDALEFEHKRQCKDCIGLRDHMGRQRQVHAKS